MMIVGENLKGLLEQSELAPLSAYDGFSINLTLNHVIFAPRKVEAPVEYPGGDCRPAFDRQALDEGGDLLLKSGAAVLACSNEWIQMPLGYAGLVQTKGSLARLFVGVHMNDGQVEPGFKGRLTFEIVNLAPFDVAIRVKAQIAQLFIFACSDSRVMPYSGRYGDAQIPTLFQPRP